MIQGLLLCSHAHPRKISAVCSWFPVAIEKNESISGAHEEQARRCSVFTGKRWWPLASWLPTIMRADTRLGAFRYSAILCTPITSEERAMLTFNKALSKRHLCLEQSWVKYRLCKFHPCQDPTQALMSLVPRRAVFETLTQKVHFFHLKCPVVAIWGTN